MVNSTGTYDTVYVYHEGQRVAEMDNEGNKKFIHGDHLGSSSIITDEDSEVIERTAYTPYGVVLTGGRESRFGYEGKEHSKAKMPTSGLVSYYSFEIDANDEISGNDGVVTGAVNKKGKVRSGYEFDGDGDYIKVDDSSSLDTNGDYTLSMWIYNAAGSNTYPTLINRRSQSDSHGYLWIFTGSTDESRIRFQYNNGSKMTEVAWSSALGKDVWNHAVFVYADSADTITLYIDGISRGSKSAPNVADITAEDLYMGTYQGNSAYTFEGKLDEVGLWNRALSTDEINELYDYGDKFDERRGEIDFNFRMYKAEWGVFTQPDSWISDIYNPQTLNRYAFENNNPYNRVDPDGHNPIVSRVLGWIIRGLGSLLGIVIRNFPGQIGESIGGWIGDLQGVQEGIQ